jgi:peptide/nickel transport system substrate-binding protein
MFEPNITLVPAVIKPKLRVLTRSSQGPETPKGGERPPKDTRGETRVKQDFKRLAVAGLGTAILAVAAPAAAQELKIGLGSEATVDRPAFPQCRPQQRPAEAHLSRPRLQRREPEEHSRARGLLEADLRHGLGVQAPPDVKFSNGMAFTARDVIYTFCRIPTVENSPSSFNVFTRGITAIETPDPQTDVFKMAAPSPLLPNNVATLGILSAELNGATSVTYDPKGCKDMGTPPKSADFNDPRQGRRHRAQLARETTPAASRCARAQRRLPGAASPPGSAWCSAHPQPGRPGSPPCWAGDVDMIETPPIQDIDRSRWRRHQIVQGISNRINLPPHGPAPGGGLEDARRQGHGQEPLPRQARA